MKTPSQMKANKYHLRGYALVVVMTIMIFLSGLGILALNNVTVGVRESALQRIGEQAFETSDSTVALFSQYAGTSAAALLHEYDSKYEASSAFTPGGQGRDNWAYQLGAQDALHMIEGNGNNTTSPFASQPSELTFENQLPTNLQVVLRDLSDGIQAPGYSNNFCFKRALIASEGIVGLNPNAPRDGEMFGSSVTAKEVLIGPVRCQNGGN